MTPPRVIRNRSPSSASRGISFQYNLQYQLIENTQPFGSFKIQFPSFFPNKIHIPKLQLMEASETKSFSITLNPDDSLIESMLVQPFVHTIRFPFDPNPPQILPNTNGSTNSNIKPHRNIPRRNLNIESFLPEYLQIDFRPLLLPNKKEISITCTPTGYKYFTFTVSIDKPLMDALTIKKFSPLFVLFKAIDNMPDVPYKQSELEANYAPVFYKCTVNKNDYVFRPQSHGNRLVIDTYVSIFPKIQTDFYFEVHDRDSSLPSLLNAIGTGMIYPYTKSKEEQKIKGLHLDVESLISPQINNKTSLGFCNFRVLPARKCRVAIYPSKEASVVSPGNFFESQTELSIEIIDPIEKFSDYFKEINMPNPSLSPYSSNASLQQKKSDSFSTPTKGFRLKGLTNSQKKLQNSTITQNCESNTTRYYRWIFTCDADENEYSTQIFNTIDEFNSKNVNEKNKSLLNTYKYDRAIKTSIDLITGFILVTPEEKIMVVETRADEPNEATNILYETTKNLSNKCHFLADRSMHFPYPRMYSGFDSLIKLVSIPIPMSNLLRIDGLYFHKSTNSILFPVIQKLNYLLTCKSIKTAEDCDYFPTEKEVIQLISKAEILTDIPIQKCIPPIEISSPEEKQKKLNKACKSPFFRSMVDPFISISSIGMKMLSDINDPNLQKKLKEEEIRKRIQEKINNHKSIFDVGNNDNNRNSIGRNSRITSSANKPRFEPYGTIKQKKMLTPRDRIGCTDNGDEEIWIVNDINEVPVEEGWKIQIIEETDDTIYRSPSTYRKLEKMKMASRNTTQSHAVDPLRRNKKQNKKTITVKRAQTELAVRKPFQS